MRGGIGEPTAGVTATQTNWVVAWASARSFDLASLVIPPCLGGLAARLFLSGL